MKKSLQKIEQLVRALVEHPSVEKAAAAVGISESTAWRWVKSLEFRQQQREFLRVGSSRHAGRLQGAASMAVSSLVRTLADKEATAASKVRAAEVILSEARSAYDREVLLFQLEQLESNASVDENDDLEADGWSAPAENSFGD
jgi:hypothetical protein